MDVVLHLILLGIVVCGAARHGPIGQQAAAQPPTDELTELSVLEQLKAEVVSIRTEVTANNDHLKAELTANNDQLKAELTALTANSDQLEAELTAKNDQLQEQLSDLKIELVTQRTSHYQQLVDLTSILTNINTTLINQASVGVVAFLVKRAGFTGSSETHTVIPFDVVDLNIGAAYDTNTGAFTAPSDGIYLFSYECQADEACGGNNIGIFLTKNRVGISLSFSEVYASGGTAVTIQLNVGDTVSVEVGHGAACHTIRDNVLNNKFSGVLLYEIV